MFDINNFHDISIKRKLSKFWYQTASLGPSTTCVKLYGILDQLLMCFHHKVFSMLFIGRMRIGNGMNVQLGVQEETNKLIYVIHLKFVIRNVVI